MNEEIRRNSNDILVVAHCPYTFARFTYDSANWLHSIVKQILHPLEIAQRNHAILAAYHSSFAFAPKIEVLSNFIAANFSKRTTKKRQRSEAICFSYQSSENVNNIIRVFVHVRCSCVVHNFLLSLAFFSVDFYNDSFIVVKLLLFLCVIWWTKQFELEKHNAQLRVCMALDPHGIGVFVCVCVCKWARK